VILGWASCASCGGLFQYAYSVCKGVDKLIPVDIYVPGCPPRPEALTEGLMRVQDAKVIRRERLVLSGAPREPALGALTLCSCTRIRLR